MIVRSLIDDIALTDREVNCPHGGFTSFRFLLKRDGLGFSLSKTVIPAGSPQYWHYKNHVEACYCISGKGVLRNSRTDEEFIIEPDVMYALNKNDPHVFTAIEEVILICVFNPPLIGAEVHQADGSYGV